MKRLTNLLSIVCLRKECWEQSISVEWGECEELEEQKGFVMADLVCAALFMEVNYHPELWP